MTARTVALTPHTPNDIGAWYGHGMSADVEDVGAGAEFTLDDAATLVPSVTVGPRDRTTDPTRGWESTMGTDYAISHLREHAAAVRRTIAAYGDDREAVDYWSACLASVDAAIDVLAREGEDGRPRWR